MTWKLHTLVTLCLLCGFACHLTLSEEIAEFQYPCYVGVCTFPRQFCNSDKYEKRCSPCSESICKQNRIPLACKYQCNLINNPKKPTSGPATNTNPPIDNSGSEESSVVPSWQEHPAWFYLCVGLAIFAIVVSTVLYITWRKKRNNWLEAITPETESLTEDSETHGNGAASEMDNTVSNQSTIPAHGGGTDAFKPSYCENKLKNVPPTDSGIQYTQDGGATAKVATSVSGFDDGKSRSEA